MSGIVRDCPAVRNFSSGPKSQKPPSNPIRPNPIRPNPTRSDPIQPDPTRSNQIVPRCLPWMPLPQRRRGAEVQELRPNLPMDIDPCLEPPRDTVTLSHSNIILSVPASPRESVSRPSTKTARLQPDQTKSGILRNLNFSERFLRPAWIFPLLKFALQTPRFDYFCEDF